MSSTQLNEYLVSAGAYQPRYRPPGPRAKRKRNGRRSKLLGNARSGGPASFNEEAPPIA